jgi:hypothetical protein
MKIVNSAKPANWTRLRRSAMKIDVAAVGLLVASFVTAPSESLAQAAAAASFQQQEVQQADATSPPRLAEIKRIYIDEMPNELHRYMAVEMSKRLKGRVQPVLSEDDADAILTGTGDHKSGVGAAVTGRLFGLHDTATAVFSGAPPLGEALGRSQAVS